MFSLEDIFKWFPGSSRSTVKNQLGSWIAKGYLLRLRRNLYFLKETGLKEEFILANYLYQPSYVSLESALNYHGIIPDVPFTVTSVTTKKTQEFKTPFGLYTYRTLKSELFFGWQGIKAGEQNYKLATPEKTLFDYLWLNQRNFGKNFPEEERFSFGKDFDWSQFKQYVFLIKNKTFQRLAGKLYD